MGFRALRLGIQAFDGSFISLRAVYTFRFAGPGDLGFLGQGVGLCRFATQGVELYRYVMVLGQE